MREHKTMKNGIPHRKIMMSQGLLVNIHGFMQLLHNWYFEVLVPPTTMDPTVPIVHQPVTVSNPSVPHDKFTV